MRTSVKIAILCSAVLVTVAGWKGLNALLYNDMVVAQTQGEQEMAAKIQKSDKEWKGALSEEQYKVLRLCGTEHPFTGKFNDHWEKGVYVCAGCGTPLFRSEAKYEHGTGWPSFTFPVDDKNIEYRDDYSLLTKRIEVRCAVCGGHLGHIFDDGPAPTYLHYCVNSLSMDFVPDGSNADRAASASPSPAQEKTDDPKEETLLPTEVATFAAGCFWGIEDKFSRVPGVLSTMVGYAGGKTKNPTYEQVCSNTTGHAESVQVTFDPAQVGYEDLVRFFFNIHDPTQVNRQGPDVGSQYRSVIFFHTERQKEIARKVMDELTSSGAFRGPLATELLPSPEFYKAEQYHQKYYQKNGIIRD